MWLTLAVVAWVAFGITQNISASDARNIRIFWSDARALIGGEDASGHVDPACGIPDSAYPDCYDGWVEVCDPDCHYEPNGRVSMDGMRLLPSYVERWAGSTSRGATWTMTRLPARGSLATGNGNSTSTSIGNGPIRGTSSRPSSSTTSPRT